MEPFKSTINVLSDLPLTNKHPIKQNDKCGFEQHLVKVDKDIYEKIKIHCPKRLSRWGGDYQLIINHPLNDPIKLGSNIIMVYDKMIKIVEFEKPFRIHDKDGVLILEVNDRLELLAAIETYKTNRPPYNSNILIDNAADPDELLIVLKCGLFTTYHHIQRTDLDLIYNSVKR